MEEKKKCLLCNEKKSNFAKKQEEFKKAIYSVFSKEAIKSLAEYIGKTEDDIFFLLSGESELTFQEKEKMLKHCRKCYQRVKKKYPQYF